MRLGTILILVAIVLAIWLIFRGTTRENFFPNNSLTVNWAPDPVAPQDMAYNWGVCISAGPSTDSGIGQCKTQTPNYPPGTPTSMWDYKGQTAKGVSSLTLNSTNCKVCSTGQVLTLLLQSVNLSLPTLPTSEWAAFTIDLTSKSTLIKNSISDSTNPNMALHVGSTGFTYILQLNDPVFVLPNNAISKVAVLRGGATSFYYTSAAPVISTSPDNTTGIYTASFTSASPNAPWNNVPGPLQLGDVVTVYVSVSKPGTSSADGEILYAGNISQTAISMTPAAPTGIVWNLV